MCTQNFDTYLKKYYSKEAFSISTPDDMLKNFHRLDCMSKHTRVYKRIVIFNTILIFIICLIITGGSVSAAIIIQNILNTHEKGWFFTSNTDSAVVTFDEDSHTVDYQYTIDTDTITDESFLSEEESFIPSEGKLNTYDNWEDACLVTGIDLIRIDPFVDAKKLSTDIMIDKIGVGEYYSYVRYTYSNNCNLNIIYHYNQSGIAFQEKVFPNEIIYEETYITKENLSVLIQQPQENIYSVAVAFNNQTLIMDFYEFNIVEVHKAIDSIDF